MWNRQPSASSTFDAASFTCNESRVENMLEKWISDEENQLHFGTGAGRTNYNLTEWLLALSGSQCP